MAYFDYTFEVYVLSKSNLGGFIQSEEE